MPVKRLLVALVLSIAVSSGVYAAGPVVPAIGTFPMGEIVQKDLVSDQIFMDAMWGMRIGRVAEKPSQITIETTGAVFRFTPASGAIECSQRLGKRRLSFVATLGPGALDGLSVTAKGTGGVVLKSRAMQMKVNCDSLLMIRALQPATAQVDLRWKPLVNYAYDSSRLLMDQFGAVGLLPIRGVGVSPEASAERCSYELKANGELWIACGPPRPYNWKNSLNYRLIWQGSWQKPEYAVPSDDQIRHYATHGNILWLQSEEMMWKSWHTDYEPRLPTEFQRVLDTSSKLGLRVMSYCSPYYFYKSDSRSAGLSAEGSNGGVYLEAIDSLLANYPAVQGIYFDGVYPSSVENTYRICRATRAYLGDKRMLMIHCTGNAPGGLVYNPCADTYADMILRGEGQGFVSEEWLRFYVSCYNISNAIGVVCNNAGHWIASPKQIEMTLGTNCRLTYMPFEAEEFPTGNVYAVNLPPAEVEKRIVSNLSTYYWPKLNKDYPKWFEGRNSAASFSLSQQTPGPPPYPLNGLKIGDLRKADEARLVLDSFGVDGDEFATSAYLNGVAIGSIPPTVGDAWRTRLSMPIPKQAIATVKAANMLRIENPNGDCFKLRNVYLEFTLPGGRKASSKLVSSVYTGNAAWIYAEGYLFGERQPIDIPIPIVE